jgi:nucleotide-binding universal stress UspA family protein
MSNLTTERNGRPAAALEEHPADPIVEHVILVTDGGPAGGGAQRWVAHRAKMHRLNVEIDMVVELDWLAAEAGGADYGEAAEKMLNEVEEHLQRTAPSARVQTVVTWGNPRERFEQASEHADLIVVGTNRSGRLAGMMASTFPVKLAESARCPAVVVPKSWKPGHGAVVVGIQGDDHDAPALRFAVHEARVLHRELRVVHSWQIPSMLSPLVMLARSTPDIAHSHDAVLAGVVDSLRSENLDLDIRGVLVEGDAAGTLARESVGAELLVVGSHGLTVSDRFFVGSISREILSRPPCPVAVVRPRRS